jgi:RNA 3'-terminal phosphate cyclase (ATP)
VAQTVLPALLIADGNSTLEIEGGTHNMAAPPFEFLQQVYLPVVSRLGPRFESQILRYGFYPAGGGRIRLAIRPARDLRGLDLLDRGGRVRPSVTALVAKLPAGIGQREVDTICRKSGWSRKHFRVQEIEDSAGPGNCVMIRLQYPGITEMFTGFGRRGVPAEQVALTAWRQASVYLAHSAPVGEYLADQLLLPLAIAASRGHGSHFRTGPLSSHARTHIQVIEMFLDVGIEAVEQTGGVFGIRVHPK